jgi:hypothetical protein
VLLTLGNPHADHTGRQEELVPAQVDTAADLTVLPSQVIARLQLIPVDEYPILGFGGEVEEYVRYLVELSIHGVPESFVIPVVVAEGEPHALVGRDVLNQLRITLDGPRQLMDIE